MMQKTSAFERIRASDVFVTLVVCTAVFSDTFVYDLIIPFIPQMLEHRLNLPQDQVQIWTSALLGIFGGFFAVGNVLTGYLTDHSPSTKFPFLVGMITMIASSLMFFLGQHIAVTTTARALQGLSASFVWVSGLAFLNSQIKPSYIGTAMGYVSVSMAVGEILGPLTGGVMYEHVGHFAVLGLVCGILGVDVILRLLLVEKPSYGQSQPDSNQDDEARPLINGDATCEVGTPTSGAADAQGTAKPKHLEIFGFCFDSDLCASFYAACIIGTIRYAFESALSIFVSQRFAWSTTASGGILFAFLSPAILGPLVGAYITKHGPRWFSIVTFSILTAALVALGFLTQPNTATKILFVIVVTVTGICLSSLTTVQIVAFSVAVKRKELKAKQAGKSGNTGIAFGSFSTAWTVGMFVGPFTAELFIDHVSWLAFCIFLAALCAASAGVTAFAWREWEVPDED